MLIWTYNRADEVELSIRSVLAQTYQDFEIILVDNGSTDHTSQVLEQYRTHPKIRIFRLEKNRGVTGGMNFALDQVSGEWFGTLGDHDELVPHAFETMMRVPEEVDPGINAVTSNSISSTTGAFYGRGLDKDQYLPLETIVSKVSGEFFGLAKTELVGENRLNENLLGNENTFWYKIDAAAKRYYIHQGLKIFNTDEGNSFTEELKSLDIQTKMGMYHELTNEAFFWDVLNKYNPNRALALSIRGYFFSKVAGNTVGLEFYGRKLKSGSGKYRGLYTILRASPRQMLKWGSDFIGNTLLGYRIMRMFVRPFGEIRQS